MDITLKNVHFHKAVYDRDSGNDWYRVVFDVEHKVKGEWKAIHREVKVKVINGSLEEYFPDKNAEGSYTVTEGYTIGGSAGVGHGGQGTTGSASVSGSYTYQMSYNVKHVETQNNSNTAQNYAKWDSKFNYPTNNWWDGCKGIPQTINISYSLAIKASPTQRPQISFEVIRVRVGKKGNRTGCEDAQDNIKLELKGNPVKLYTDFEPAKPAPIDGPSCVVWSTKLKKYTYTFYTDSVDPSWNALKYKFAWGDGSAPTTVGPADSARQVSAQHEYEFTGTGTPRDRNYTITVTAIDNVTAKKSAIQTKTIKIKTLCP